MRIEKIYILLLGLVALLGCKDNEILDSYTRIKETEPIPLRFTPYVGTNIEQEATTRADLNYLSYVNNNTDLNMGVFNSFPWYDEGAAKGSEAGSRTVNKVKKGNYRFGTLESNSYIVGIYGYYDHDWDNDAEIKWEDLKSRATPNFMTNQPLKHLNKKIYADYRPEDAYWDYSPLRYWPNSTITDSNGDDKDDTPVNITFVSYYPYQDFKGGDYYRDGNNGTAKLTCITPPAKDARGQDAYTFTFEQNENVWEQVDFLLGINPNVKNQSLSDAGITLNLRHTLSAVAFDLRSTAFNENNPDLDIKYEINYVKLEGLYGRGKVIPTSDGVNWIDLDKDGTDYILNYTDDAYEDNFSGHYIKPFFDGTTATRYTRQLIYNNNKDTNVKGYPNTWSDYVNNSRGMKLLMLVIPQKVEKDKNNNDKDAFLVLDYDVTFTYYPGTENEMVIVYKNCVEKMKLEDSVKQKNTVEPVKTQLFVAGRFLTFNIQLTGLKGILMDAAIEDWPDDEYLDVEGEINMGGDTNTDS